MVTRKQGRISKPTFNLHLNTVFLKMPKKCTEDSKQIARRKSIKLIGILPGTLSQKSVVAKYKFH